VEAGSDELALVVPPNHRLAGKESVGISELGLENFVAHNAASPYRDQVIAEFERKKVDLNIGIEMPSLEAIKRLVERGLGVALIPKIIAENEVRAGSLWALSVKELRLVRKLHIVYRRNCVLSHAAEAFLDLARRIQ
jgi:DNA-binding transcriptional LysR family regulator